MIYLSFYEIKNPVYGNKYRVKKLAYKVNY